MGHRESAVPSGDDSAEPKPKKSCQEKHAKYYAGLNPRTSNAARISQRDKEKRARISQQKAKEKEERREEEQERLRQKEARQQERLEKKQRQKEDREAHGHNEPDDDPEDEDFDEASSSDSSDTDSMGSHCWITWLAGDISDASCPPSPKEPRGPYFLPFTSVFNALLADADAWLIQWGGITKWNDSYLQPTPSLPRAEFEQVVAAHRWLGVDLIDDIKQLFNSDSYYHGHDLVKHPELNMQLTNQALTTVHLMYNGIEQLMQVLNKLEIHSLQRKIERLRKTK
ncbi:hypothetical protein C8R43DRAFT_949437 [Mycena crocata]|nr:hypothetical protein C8R43DRAFT_949437 [Mycena crocata]